MEKDEKEFIEDEAWAQEVGDVKPLSDKKPKTRHLMAEKVEAFDWEDNPSQLSQSMQIQQDRPTLSDIRVVGERALSSDVLTIFHNEVSCLSGSIQSMDQAIFKKLKKGQILPTDCLDLHGFFEGDAWLALMDYLHAAADAGHRCILVVHGKGKGYGLQKDMGVIKAQCASWLAHHPRVLAFHTAVPRDGGQGAVYVYLRRKR